MGQFTAGWCDYLTSWLVFIVVAPLLLATFTIVALLEGILCFCCCTHPVVPVQRFACWVLTGPLRLTYLGVLLIRLCGWMDMLLNASAFLSGGGNRMWIDTIVPQKRAYWDRMVGKNVVLWANLRLGDYQLCRDLMLDDKRHRTHALDGWICGFAAHNPNLPIFFNTGTEFHKSFRKVIKENFTGRASTLRALENQGELLADFAKPMLDRWLDSADKGLVLSDATVPVMMRLLLEVETPLPEKMLKAFWTFVFEGAGYYLLPPWAPYQLAKSTTKAQQHLKEFMLEHCNAQKPETLKGLGLDWKAMVAELPGLLPKKGTTKVTDPTDALADAMASMLCLAGVTGTTAGFGKVMAKFVPVQFSLNILANKNKKLPWNSDCAAMLELYVRSPIDFILEACRLEAPVAGTQKVLTEDFKCPFLHKETMWPKGTVCVANMNVCHTDAAEWGDDALTFRPGRAPRDRYLLWNGPFGGDAPRQCPGEQVAVNVIKVCMDAFLERYKDEIGAVKPRNVKTF
eukprot:TRINITY_DN15787_c1_g1_i1.p1 TRINITY_DN15787_c1_g1~~TRINITY_DN15787_c1_g1_i1.p1  ORF type:complete len:568 (-),score=111.00 TRINITY_DN15787_c1_g1_i1:633-2174(-)